MERVSSRSRTTMLRMFALVVAGLVMSVARTSHAQQELAPMTVDSPPVAGNAQLQFLGDGPDPVSMFVTHRVSGMRGSCATPCQMMVPPGHYSIEARGAYQLQTELALGSGIHRYVARPTNRSMVAVGGSLTALGGLGTLTGLSLVVLGAAAGGWGVLISLLVGLPATVAGAGILIPSSFLLAGALRPQLEPVRLMGPVRRTTAFVFPSASVRRDEQNAMTLLSGISF